MCHHWKKLILNKSTYKISSMYLFEFKKIGVEILQNCKIETKMALLLMQKFEQ